MNTKVVTFVIALLTILINRIFHFDETIRIGISLTALVILLIINRKKIASSPVIFGALIITFLIGLYFTSLA